MHPAYDDKCKRSNYLRKTRRTVDLPPDFVSRGVESKTCLFPSEEKSSTRRYSNKPPFKIVSPFLPLFFPPNFQVTRFPSLSRTRSPPAKVESLGEPRQVIPHPETRMNSLLLLSQTEIGDAKNSRLQKKKEKKRNMKFDAQYNPRKLENHPGMNR